jgi:hypothetical protein
MPGEQLVCHARIDVGSSGVTRITLSLPLTAGVGGVGVGWAAPSDAVGVVVASGNGGVGIAVVPQAASTPENRIMRPATQLPHLRRGPTLALMHLPTPSTNYQGSPSHQLRRLCNAMSRNGFLSREKIFGKIHRSIGIRACTDVQIAVLSDGEPKALPYRQLLDGQIDKSLAVPDSLDGS